MLNVTETCKALTFGHLPAFLENCATVVGPLANAVLGVVNTETMPNSPGSNNRPTELLVSKQEGSMGLPEIVTAAITTGIGIYLLKNCIRTVSNRNSVDRSYGSSDYSSDDCSLDRKPFGEGSTEFERPLRNPSHIIPLALRTLVDKYITVFHCDIEKSFEEFNKYLEQYALKHPETVKLAKENLGIDKMPGGEDIDFYENNFLTHHGLLGDHLKMNGKEFVAQAWNLIEKTIPQKASPEPVAEEKERENCRADFVKALAHRSEDGERPSDYAMCSLIINDVLQSRLPGSGTDGTGINLAILLNAFLQLKDIKYIRCEEELITKTRDFLSSIKNISSIDKEIFIDSVKEYAKDMCIYPPKLQYFNGKPVYTVY